MKGFLLLRLFCVLSLAVAPSASIAVPRLIAPIQEQLAAAPLIDIESSANPEPYGVGSMREVALSSAADEMARRYFEYDGVVSIIVFVLASCAPIYGAMKAARHGSLATAVRPGYGWSRKTRNN